MLRRPLALSGAVILCVCATVLPVLGAKSWKTYRGAWFDIKYPQNFKVQPRERSSSSLSGYDGVSFISPDGRVEFYVFSPQWWGEDPQWTQLRSGERMVDVRTEAKGDSVAKWVTVAGPGSAYERSWVVNYNKTLNTRRVFGYKYRNRAAYEAYRTDYLKFKTSLKQYAD